MKTLTYKLTPAEYAAKLAEVKSVPDSGLKELSGTCGTISHSHVDAAYEYDEASQTLMVTIQHKPAFVPEKVVANKLAEWFEKK